MKKLRGFIVHKSLEINMVNQSLIFLYFQEDGSDQGCKSATLFFITSRGIIQNRGAVNDSNISSGYEYIL